MMCVFKKKKNKEVFVCEQHFTRNLTPIIDFQIHLSALQVFWCDVE